MKGQYEYITLIYSNAEMSMTNVQSFSLFFSQYLATAAVGAAHVVCIQHSGMHNGNDG